MFQLKSSVILLFAQTLLASPVGKEKRASCPNIHVFGARETTAPAGYGSAGTVVDLILNAHSGATSEAINYPACGGQSSCGGVSYADSVVQGISAITSAVNSFNTECPDTQLVLVGYSQVSTGRIMAYLVSQILIGRSDDYEQGGQITDDALCGGGDPNEGYSSTAVTFSASALKQIKAAIFMGDPRFVSGLSYEVGTCKAGGVSTCFI